MKEYLLEPIKKLTLEERRLARKRLEDLTKTGLGIEKLPQENIAQALLGANYSRISSEFLRQYQLVPFTLWNVFGVKETRSLRLPKFGVYSLNDPMMIFSTTRDEFGCCNFRVLSPDNLPRVLSKELLLATEYGKDSNQDEWQHFNGRSSRYSGFFSKRKFRLPKNIEQMDYVFSSSFYGILPEETKQEISEAREIIGKNIFLITETTPSDWEMRRNPKPRVVKDPLLVGVVGDKCYLIDHFDTTPVEDYARREFLT
jgi:hypothetical protein